MNSAQILTYIYNTCPNIAKGVTYRKIAYELSARALEHNTKHPMFDELCDALDTLSDYISNKINPQKLEDTRLSLGMKIDDNDRIGECIVCALWALWHPYSKSAGALAVAYRAAASIDIDAPDHIYVMKKHAEVIHYYIPETKEL